MINFLLEEGILTIGGISGIFTTNLLNSFKINIFDPICENIIETKHLDRNSKFGPIEYINKHIPSTHIKYQTFLRDLVMWIITISILYLVWDKLLKPYKLKMANQVK